MKSIYLPTTGVVPKHHVRGTPHRSDMPNERSSGHRDRSTLLDYSEVFNTVKAWQTSSKTAVAGESSEASWVVATARTLIPAANPALIP